MSNISISTTPNDLVLLYKGGGGNSLERRRREGPLRSMMRTLIIGESESIAGMEDVVIPNECLQLVYHRAVRRHLLILYPKEILIMDLGIKQV